MYAHQRVGWRVGRAADRARCDDVDVHGYDDGDGGVDRDGKFDGVYDDDVYSAWGFSCVSWWRRSVLHVDVGEVLTCEDITISTMRPSRPRTRPQKKLER